MVIGTWAESYNASQGGKLLLYQYEKERTSLCQTIDTGKSISMLACDKEKRLLFAACETNYHEENTPGGELQVYRIEKNHTLTLLERCNSYGGFPVGIVLTERYAVVLNHGSNLSKVCVTYCNEKGRLVTEFASDEASLCMFRRTDTGSIGELKDHIVFRGRGTLPVFQDSPAPHDLYYAQEKKLIYIPMRGNDETRIYRISDEKEQFIPVGILKHRPMTGPRNVLSVHFSDQEEQEYVYVVSEIEPLITVFRENSDGWSKLQELMVVDGRPGDIPCTSFDYPHPSGILLNYNKRKLYTITRRPDVLTIFKVLENGLLEKEQEFPLAGNNPRQLALWRDKLFVVCMDTQNVLEIILDGQGYPIQTRQIIQGVERIAYMKLI